MESTHCVCYIVTERQISIIFFSYALFTQSCYLKRVDVDPKSDIYLYSFYLTCCQCKSDYLKSPYYFGWLLVIVSVSRFLCSIFFFVNSVVCVYTVCTSVWIVPQNVETLAWEIIIFSFEIQKIRPQTFKAFRMNIFYTLFVMFFFLVPFSAVTDINDKVYTLRTIKFNEIFLEWIPSKCIKDQVVSLIQFYTHSVFRFFFLVPTSVHFLSVNGTVDLKKM